MQVTDPARSGLVGRVIASSARTPLLTIMLVIALGAWALVALRDTRLDAIPDLSDTQVIVFTEWMGRSPDLVEDQITYPISSSLLAAPRVQYVRGQSMFGMSFVYVIFEDGTDMYWARSRVLEYLDTAQARMPAGATPTLGPDATGVGWVFQYALVDRSGEHSLQDLRSLQDWNIRYALESVPGVAEVASVGGMVKQYQVNVDPGRLRAYGVTLGEVARAIRMANEDVGGRVLEIAGHEHVVRGRGYIRSTADIAKIPVGMVDTDGTPILVEHVAVVELGPDIRRGVAELDGQGEVAGGIVVMRYGESALNVINAVKERLEDVRRSLPEGVELVVTYDRSGLIEEAIDTLTSTLIEEMVVVSLVIFLFLLHVRSALVPILTLPIAVLLAFIPMYYQGLTANIMSLGGIAVAIGAMVDASIIIIENIHKRLEEWEAQGRPGERLAQVIGAMQEVGPAIFFSLLVITVSFLPVFTLEATEGRLFKPLAFTKTYSMAFAALLAVTLTPALAAIFIRGKLGREVDNPLNRWLMAAYAPVVRFVVDHRKAVVALSVLAMAFTVPAFMRLGNEFMPRARRTASETAATASRCPMSRRPITSSMRSSFSVSPSSSRPVGMPVQAATTSATSSAVTFSAIIGSTPPPARSVPARSAASAASISRSTAGISPYSSREAPARSPSRWRRSAVERSSSSRTRRSPIRLWPAFSASHRAVRAASSSRRSASSARRRSSRSSEASSSASAR